ncbi:hypothetical protein RQP46_005540 [Phenoliferia psychrophenolica]
MSIPNLWDKLPNEPTSLKNRRSPPSALDSHSPYRAHAEFNPSPRSSISSSSVSGTPTSSASPAHPSAPLPSGLFLESSLQTTKATPASPHATPSLGLYPDTGVFSGLAFLSGRERDFGLTSFGPPTALTPPSATTALPLPLPPSPSHIPTPAADSPAEHGGEHTQSLLESIFQGNPRPHFRSTSLTPAEQSPRQDNGPEVSRSYFSPPPPSSPNATRSRSHSTTAIQDHPGAAHNGISMTSQQFGRPMQQQQQQQSQQADPQTGYRPSSSISSHYSSSLPANIPNASRGGPSSSINMSDNSSPRFGGGGDFGSASYGAPGAFGRTSVSSSLGGPGYDQTGWRAAGSGGGAPKQASYGGWEDAEREGRARSRAEDQQRPWGDRDPSTGSAAGSGIGLSNMSPFSRDGGRTLADLADGGAGYRARREYSLGAVGSGRKRGESVWGSSRPLREAEDEDAEDAFAPTKSGATSRRHSVSAFGAPSRSQIGFTVPDSGDSSSRDSYPNGGGRGLQARGGFGTGSSAINDDDLAADLNSLHLNLEAHVAATESKNGTSPQRPFQHVGSMPTHFPQTGRYDDSTSRSPPAIGSRQLQSPNDLSSTGGPSRFFQPPPQQPNGSRGTSRFEFGGVGSPGSSSFQPNDFNQQGPYRGGPPVDANRFLPSFGLPPPSPPNSFYSQPLSGHGLSAVAPAFQAFPSPQSGGSQQQHQQQQASFFPSAHMGPATGPDLSNLGRGIPLHSVPNNAPLYIVEFKAGRKDLFFSEDQQLVLRQGDLVIVEADRGKDIGKLLKPCSVDEVQAFQQRLVEMALGQLANPGGGAPPNPAAIARMTKEFTPKKIFGKAQAVDTQLLLSKAQDEVKALALIRTKVVQKNLAMEVCDAEWQWDRRKLTFYYTSGNRVDFRELVRELFRLYKTRIWMCCLDQEATSWSFK